MNNKESTEYKVNITSKCDIMFDRFYRQEADTRPPEEKLYLTADRLLALPAENIYSFLTAAITSIEKKQAKPFLQWMPACLFVTPTLIPFTRDGKPIQFKPEWTTEPNDYLEISEFSPVVHKGRERIKQNPKARPVLKVPWELAFTIMLYKNAGNIDHSKLSKWFEDGGIFIALGTFRPRYGRFTATVEEIG